MVFDIHSTNDFGHLWPIKDFNEVYSEEGIKSLVVATFFDAEFPDKTGMIIFRTFIEKSERARKDQKYIIGLRFYTFGNFATIDLISLDKEFHREICYEHLKKMNFPMWGAYLEEVDYYSETTRAPFVFAGGHLKISEDDSVEFFGDSGDYSGKLLLSDCNSLARYIASVSGIESSKEAESGKAFVKHLLEFMFENKLKREFYQNFVADLYLQKEEVSLNSQNIGALIAMKVIDRLTMNEGNDFIGLMVEEITDGLPREIMLHSMARRIRSEK